MFALKRARAFETTLRLCLSKVQEPAMINAAVSHSYRRNNPVCAWSHSTPPPPSSRQSSTPVETADRRNIGAAVTRKAGQRDRDLFAKLRIRFNANARAARSAYFIGYPTLATPSLRPSPVNRLFFHSSLSNAYQEAISWRIFRTRL